MITCMLAATHINPVLSHTQMGIPLSSPSASGMSSEDGSSAGSSSLSTAAVAAAALSDAAAADHAVAALRQAAAAGLLLVSAQVRLLVEAFVVSMCVGTGMSGLHGTAWDCMELTGWFAFA